MTWFEESTTASEEKWKRDLARFVYEEMKKYPYDKTAALQRETWKLIPYQEKEAHTMQVEYNGFTGELVKLERKDLRVFGIEGSEYSLVIEDKEKHVKHDFDNVKMENVKFLGGAVSFGG